MILRVVHRFERGALVARAIAGKGDCDMALAINLAGNACAHCDRCASADDTVCAQHALVDIGDVHRSALAARNAGLAARQFGHHKFGVDTAQQHMAMVAVPGDDAVLIGQRCLDTGRDGFLTDIEVAEAANKTEAV